MTKTENYLREIYSPRVMTNKSKLYLSSFLILLIASIVAFAGSAPAVLATPPADPTCSVCDFTGDAVFSTEDAEQLAQCIFSSGINECLNTDINGDESVTAADITACALCSEDSSAFPNCGGCDRDTDGEISEDEIEQIVACTFVSNINQCYNRDANEDGVLDAGDVSYCALHCGRSFDIGDVTQDGTINSADALFIGQYLAGLRTLSEEQLRLADVNQFGGVDEMDARVIQNMVVDLKGDVNGDDLIDVGDALLINQHLNELRVLTKPQLAVADTVLDEQITEADAIILAELEVFKKGDVNGDKEFNSGDALLIGQALNRLRTLSNVQRDMADVNLDGSMTTEDATLLHAYVIDKRGDLDGDDQSNERDALSIEEYLADTRELSFPVQSKLADVNKDGRVTQEDANKIWRANGGKPRKMTRGLVAAYILRGMDKVPQEAITSTSFTDVPKTNPYHPYVEKFAELDISQGCGRSKFCVDRRVTRGETAVFIIKAMGETPGDSDRRQTFSDVPKTHAFYPFVEKFSELGISKGCGRGKFCVNHKVSKYQLKVFLRKAFGVRIR